MHLLWLRREDEAIAYFRKALEWAPEFFMARWGLGRAYLRQGRFGAPAVDQPAGGIGVIC
jgi:tetratricopeptide (TPR) repeat protein